MIGETLSTFLNTRWSFFSNKGQGILLNTFQRELGNVGDTLGNLATLLASGMQFVIYLIVPLSLNMEMTLIEVML